MTDTHTKENGWHAEYLKASDRAMQLERELAEVRAERDQLFDTLETAKTWIEESKATLIQAAAERDAARAALGKCREALEEMIRVNGGVAVMPTKESREQNAALALARETLKQII